MSSTDLGQIATEEATTMQSTSTSPPAAATSPTPAPPKRKSRVLRRKTDHSVIERRRREKINLRLIELQEMVPACREEALEVLSKKKMSPASSSSTSGRRGKKTEEEVQKLEEEAAKYREQETQRRLKEEMVLEKLCIISHTVGELITNGAAVERPERSEVIRDIEGLISLNPTGYRSTDYIVELQSQVEAYRKLCQCDPPVQRLQQPPRDPALHQQFAHDLSPEAIEDSGIEVVAGGSVQTAQGSSTSASPPVQAGSPRASPEYRDTLLAPEPCPPHCSLGTVATTKRKRHWGSDRHVPIKSTQQGTSSSTIDKKRRVTNHRDAAASCSEDRTASDLPSMTEDNEDETEGEAEEDEDDDEEYLATVDDSTEMSPSTSRTAMRRYSDASPLRGSMPHGMAHLFSDLKGNRATRYPGYHVPSWTPLFSTAPGSSCRHELPKGQVVCDRKECRSALLPNDQAGEESLTALQYGKSISPGADGGNRANLDMLLRASAATTSHSPPAIVGPGL